jgi:mono/diheme cytochrome c family protein
MAYSTCSSTFSARRISLTGLMASAAIVMMLSAACGGSSANPGSPTSPSSAATPDPLVSTGPLAYDPDLKAIFQSDCVRCHGSSGASGGYSATSYAGVMAAVSPGNPQSRLVTVTQPSGSMYSHFSGDRAGRSNMVRSWVVTYNAAATR